MLPELADLSFTEETRNPMDLNNQTTGIIKADRLSKDVRSSRQLMNDLISDMRDSSLCQTEMNLDTMSRTSTLNRDSITSHMYEEQNEDGHKSRDSVHEKIRKKRARKMEQNKGCASCTTDQCVIF